MREFFLFLLAATPYILGFCAFWALVYGFAYLLLA